MFQYAAARKDVADPFKLENLRGFMPTGSDNTQAYEVRPVIEQTFQEYFWVLQGLLALQHPNT